MAEVNWTVFENLSGARTTNWELLCRELVRRNYERYGIFHSLAQQAGIEFHLDLSDTCSLGDSTKHWGWQCKWYEVAAGKSIGTTRKKQIEDSIKKTEKYLPNLTDWVLWTQRSLTPKDQEWFYDIKTNFKLRLWTDQEVIGHLTGEAELLRSTYFGELVLTPEKLAYMHEESVAPIKKRWEPQLHVEVDVERNLKSTLGTPGTWGILREASDRLNSRELTLKSEMADLRDHEKELVEKLLTTLTNQKTHLLALADALDEGRVGKVRQNLENSISPEFSKSDLAQLASKLRAVRNSASLSIASASWEIGNYFSLLNNLKEKMNQNLFAVVGDAGFGKTFLAVELTKPTDKFPGGVLLHAKYLGNNGSLDDLVRRVSFGGDRMDQLIEAIDAVGARLDRRIPIVIDGLNESENPRDWKDLLATLQVRLNRCTHCVIIVTLRSAVSEDVLPAEIDKVSLRGFEYETRTAIRTYFDYYKIDPTDAQLPWRRFASPLFLSLFCQVTNPDRKKIVGVEAIPRSLTAVFEKYRELVVSRAAHSLNLAQQDVESGLERVGLALWNENSRTFDFNKLREIVGDQPRAWDNSLARVFEEEGVLTRDPVPHFGSFGNREGNQVTAILYDAFAGFVIADAILTQQGREHFTSWVTENWERLNPYATAPDTENVCHPLAEDILAGFVGLLPRKFYTQMWKSLPSPLLEVALLETTNLEAGRIDQETVVELRKLCKQKPEVGRRNLFSRLSSTRASTNHPLNAEFLHLVLFEMAVGERDLRWTEWLRKNRGDIIQDLKELECQWSQTKERGESDRLYALWTSWTLTSTANHVRDQATKSLYLYGLGSPEIFFKMVVDSLDINDPYIPERMFAAAYGVVMGSQLSVHDLHEPLAWFLSQIKERILGSNCLTPTNHWMTRMYVQGIFSFAEKFLPEAIPQDIDRTVGRIIFGAKTTVHATTVDNQYTGYIDYDFEHKEFIRLFPHLSRHDDDNPEVMNAWNEVRRRIWELGYREEMFTEIDKQISNHYAYRQEPRPEPYVLKYARIGGQELAGVLTDKRQPSGTSRTGRGNPSVDIDPSFPRQPRHYKSDTPDWVDQPPEDNKEWLSSGQITIPKELLRPSKLGSHEGPWIAVDGSLVMTNRILGRKVFGLLYGFMVSKSDVEQVKHLVKTQEYLGNLFFPEIPSDYYTFAGEIPWSEEFANDPDDYDAQLGLYKRKLGGYGVDGPIVEVLCHSYTFEGIHRLDNPARGFSVPSKSFSNEYQLLSQASSLKQFDSDGKVGAMPCVPEGFDSGSNILFIREDLLRKYASTRDQILILVFWGERNLTSLGYDHPEWYREISQNRLNYWKQIVFFFSNGD